MDIRPPTGIAPLTLAATEDAGAKLHGRRLRTARLASIAVLVLALAVFAAAIPLEFARLQSVCTGDRCLHPWLSPEILAEMQAYGLSARWFAAYFGGLVVLQAGVWYIVGLLLFWRRPNDRTALLAALALVTAGTAFGVDLRALGEASPIWGLPAVVLGFLGGTCLYLLLFLFPDGRFVPGWTRWLMLAALLIQAFTSFLPDTPLDPETWPPVAGVATYLLVGGGGIAAQVYRYRRTSSLLERQQTKWVMCSLIGMLGLLLSLGVANLFITTSGLLVEVAANTALFVAMLLIPLAILRAVMRYQLWDIDLIIKRALVYGTLTVVVIGLYVLIVGYLGALLRAEYSLAISLVATGVVAVLFQPLREWLQRGVNRLLYGERDDPYVVVSRLGQRLEAALAPEAVLPAIAETVAQALKLPYTALTLKQADDFVVAAEYPDTNARTGADAATNLEAVPRSPERLASVPLTYQGEIVGKLLLAPRARGEGFSPADWRLLEDLARQAGVAAHAVRLTNDLRRSRERLVTTREEERRRLRRDLHDGLGPVLATIAMQAEAARELLETDRAAADALLADLAGQAQMAVADVRRLVYGLRPPALDDLGLLGALRAHAERSSQAGLQVGVQAPDPLPPLPAAVEVAAYRIVQEALTNVARHAHAGNCQVTLALIGIGPHQALSLEISDDGVGLNPERQAGVGLTAMHERAAELGGSCAIAPRAGGGTRVSICLPAASGTGVVSWDEAGG